MEDLFKRVCPSCCKEMIYQKKSMMVHCEKHNKKCRSCAQKSRKLYGKTTSTCITCDKTFSHFISDGERKYCGRKCFERRRKPSVCLGCGVEFYVPSEVNLKYHSKECAYQNRDPDTCFFKKNHTVNVGRVHSDETKEKISLKHRLNRSMLIQNTIQFPNFNPEACLIIENYGKENGFNFQHALNGGEFYIKELGYWVDGYDREKNVVIEYYEKDHLSSSKRIQKDEFRRKKIMETLNCEFIIVYYNQKIEIWK
jgi:hypothetical protein